MSVVEPTQVPPGPTVMGVHIPHVEILSDGTLKIDGKEYNPQVVASTVSTAERDLAIAYHELTNRRNGTLKNVEKLVVYVAAIAGATNGFGQIPMAPSVRGWIVGGAAFVLAAIHVSTPKAP